MRRPPCAASTAANRHRRAAEEKAPESRTKLSFEVKDLTLKTTLGTGTFGRVRLAKLNGNCYALKILKKSEVRARASRACMGVAGRCPDAALAPLPHRRAPDHSLEASGSHQIGG